MRWVRRTAQQSPTRVGVAPTLREGRTDAFTLVELLVVIALIAALIALLLPVLSKTREAANQVKCMSNLRQLSAAFIMYANNNRGVFPGGASGDNTYVRGPRPDDWVYWQAGRDINQSAIAPYLAARGGTLQALLRCPSDDPLHRPDPPSGPGQTNTWLYPYTYSYAMNSYLDGDPRENGFAFPQPISSYQVRRPSEKILLGEPDARLFNSGMWYPGTVDIITRVQVWRPTVPLSIRHDGPLRVPDPPYSDNPVQVVNPNRRGNVALCDGHVEFVPRSFAASREHADPRY